MDEKQKMIGGEITLESLVSATVALPGVKVSRTLFLTEVFSNNVIPLEDILEKGAVEAGVTKDELTAIANKLIFKRTSASSIASFATGLPGGFALAATIPADVLQFYGVALRLAQELSYLYGAKDIWVDGQLDSERVKNQLLLYCGVMLGVSGAASGVRVLSVQLAKTAAKKIPQKALMKTFWYPLLKQLGKAIGIRVTKTSLAKGVSKAIPVIGGVVSGTLNFASMIPMANRLRDTLDGATFGYTDEDYEKDLNIIESISEGEDNPERKIEKQERIKNAGKKVVEKCNSFFTKSERQRVASQKVILNTIQELYELKENGALTQEEFAEKKAELLAKI